MKRVLLIIAVNLALLAFIFGSYKVITNRTVEVDDIKTTSEQYSNLEHGGQFSTVDVTVLMEQGMDTQRVMSEVRNAIAYFPVDILQAFNEQEWRVFVTSYIDYTDLSSDYKYIDDIVGLTNFTTKTIYIRYDTGEGVIRLRMMHEMSHFVDDYYDYPSCKTSFSEFYDPETEPYIEFEMKDVTKTEENAVDFNRANEDVMELFACSMKDYLLHPEYLNSVRPDMYSYFERLLKK